MAIVYAAQLVPTKLELMARWLPAQPWYAGGADRLEALGAFRFDDPDGQVGVQVHVVHSGPGSAIYQVPMTYRPEPLAHAADALMGEMQHSVLGTRYVYDGCHDPVFVGELVRAILTGDTNVPEIRHTDTAPPVELPTTMHVRGSGGGDAVVPAIGLLDVVPSSADGWPTIIRTGLVEARVLRVLDQDVDPGESSVLTGTWGDRVTPCRLASVAVRDGWSPSAR
jgi:hypothetical protein